jgi:hypothetical protein
MINYDNRRVIGNDPILIIPGQILFIREIRTVRRRGETSTTQTV